MLGIVDIADAELRRDVVAAVLSDDPVPATVVRAQLAREWSPWAVTTVRRDLHVLARRGRARRVPSGWVAAERALLEV